MKRLLSFFLLALGWCLGMSAQVVVPNDWTVSEDYQDKDRMVVYGSIKDGENYRWVGENYNSVAAFIDGECRGVAYPKWNDNTSTNSFTLEIWGTEADNDKTVTFKFLDQDQVYVARETTTYTFGSTVGQPSNRFVLNITTPSYFTWKQEVVDMYVGSTLNLLDYITFNPEDAILPEGQIWTVGNFPDYLQLDGNTVKALQPTPEDMTAMVGIMLPIKSLNGQNALRIRITEMPVPITDIIILDQYKDGVTVNVGDWPTLTKILMGCYALLPENTNEVPEWSCNSQTGIVKTVDGNFGTMWNPAEPGEYTMTLSAENASATLKVTVVQPVEGMTIFEYPYNPNEHTIYTYVGQNIASLVPYMYTIVPSTATDKSVTVTIANKTIISESYEALKEGETTLTITSVDNPEAQVVVPVKVKPVYTLTVNSDPLNVEFTSDPTDISAAIKGNVTTNAPTEDVFYESVDTQMLTITNKTTGPDVKLHKTGNTTVTLSVQPTVTRYNNEENSLDLFVDLGATNKFTVVATPAVTGILLDEFADGYPYKVGDPLSLADYENTYYAVKAVPDGAILKPELLSASFVMNSMFDMQDPDMPDFVEIKEYKGKTCVMFYPNAIGKGTLTVNYGSDISDSYPMQIAQAVVPHNGWKWINIYAGSTSVDTAYFLGEDLVEARGQNAGELVYNDPVYGLFGDLTTFRMNTAYKVKGNYTGSPGSYSFAWPTEEKRAYDIPLRKTWTWLAFPYQYDQNLTKALLKYQPTEGDRVISKDGGFAEWNGTEWTGNLTTLVHGESYLYYNASGETKSMFVLPERELDHTPNWIQTNFSQRRAAERRTWQYDASQWADNMTIVADIEGVGEDYTIGAFVGDECRGEGEWIDGKWFITVHGKTGEQISFRLYDESRGTYTDVQTTTKFSQMAGSLASPMRLEVPLITGIVSMEQPEAEAQPVYDLSGRRTTATQHGLYITEGKKSIR